MKKVKFFRKSTYETRRVVVPDGLGVSIGLHMTIWSSIDASFVKEKRRFKNHVIL